jgi:hypothetical protein
MASVYGTAPYNVVQMGREATAGTSAPATTIWRGPFGGPEDTRVRKIKEEDIGLLVSEELNYDTRLGATLTMPASELTFEQVAHLLEAGIKTATPSGAGPYTRVYDLPVSNARTIKTYTLEAGNTLVAADQMEIPYAVVSEFELSGKVDEAWMMAATWTGQRWVNAAITAALSVPAVEPALFGATRFYVDDNGGTIGTTQVSGRLLECTIKVATGIQFVPIGNGNLYPTAHKYVRPELTFTMSYELEQDGAASFVATERARWQSRAGRLIRLDVPGSSAARNFQVDMYAIYDKLGAYENSDGNVSVKVEGHCGYSAANALFWTATVINSVASM